MRWLASAILIFVAAILLAQGIGAGWVIAVIAILITLD